MSEGLRILRVLNAAVSDGSWSTQLGTTDNDYGVASNLSTLLESGKDNYMILAKTETMPLYQMSHLVQSLFLLPVRLGLH